MLRNSMELWQFVTLMVLLAAGISATGVTVFDSRLSLSAKIVWVAVLLGLPPFGVVAWLVARLMRRRAAQPAV